MNPWLTCDLGEVYSIRMIAVLNQEWAPTEAWKIGPSELRVGNSTNPDENESCGVTVTEGGFFDCRLKGRYVTLRRTSAINEHWHFAEISVWADQNICPRGTATLSSVFTEANANPDRIAKFAQETETVI